MKSIINNKIKKINKEFIILFIIGSISMYYFYSSLVTSYYHDLMTFLILLCICLLLCLVFKIEFKAKIITFFKVVLYTYFIVFSILFIISIHCETKTYRVPLNGYTYYKTDKILFTFKGINFGRYHTLTQYGNVDDLTLDYDVILKLKEPISNVYIIEAMGLEKKDKVQQ